MAKIPPHTLAQVKLSGTLDFCYKNKLYKFQPKPDDYPKLQVVKTKPKQLL